MYNYFIEKIDEIYNIITAPIDDIFKKMAIKKYKSELDIENNRFSSLYIKLIGKKTGKLNGIVYTPEPISKYMFNSLIEEEDIINNPFIKILDPACGCGDIILTCFENIKEIYAKNIEYINEKHGLNLKVENISKHIIDNNLYCFDIDPIALKILTIDLYEVSNYFNEKNIINRDFLTSKEEEKFHVVIGNPPYIGHKLVDKEYSKSLKEIFKNIYKDKSDISYCFFQAAINRLYKKGKLSFITSRYFIEAPSGEELRKILKEVCTVYKVVDFYGIRPFKNVGIDPVIIFLINDTEASENIEIIKPLKGFKEEKDEFYNSLFLNNGNRYKKFYINKNCLNNKGWILRDTKERLIIDKIEEKSFTNLNNICSSAQGIITGCDKAFVVTREEVENKHLEMDLIKPWIKSSNISRDKIILKDKFLIYSDIINNPEEYPNTINHLKIKQSKLMERRECSKGIREWYQLQWGRKREIFEKEKIIYPYKGTHNTFVLDKGKYFSADIYALILKENVPFTYNYLISLLNSKVYEFYFQSFAKKLGENMYEYYPNNLLKLCIPTMGSKEEYSEEEINEFFGFTKEEIKIIYEY